MKFRRISRPTDWLRQRRRDFSRARPRPHCTRIGLWLENSTVSIISFIYSQYSVPPSLILANTLPPRTIESCEQRNPPKSSLYRQLRSSGRPPVSRVRPARFSFAVRRSPSALGVSYNVHGARASVPPQTTAVVDGPGDPRSPTADAARWSSAPTRRRCPGEQRCRARSKCRRTTRRCMRPAGWWPKTYRRTEIGRLRLRWVIVLRSFDLVLRTAERLVLFSVLAVRRRPSLEVLVSSSLEFTLHRPLIIHCIIINNYHFKCSLLDSLANF